MPYDVDALQEAVEENTRKRHAEVVKVEALSAPAGHRQAGETSTGVCFRTTVGVTRCIFKQF